MARPHIDLLAELPELEINLADLPADRLRQFLDAFAIQVQSDFHHHHATIQATISAVAVPHINRLAQAATGHHHAYGRCGAFWYRNLTRAVQQLSHRGCGTRG